jgi:uncharacterized membrane protein YcaP (DUF421 family)
MLDAFTLTMPVWEKVLRTLVVYAAIAALVRLAGKRGLAQLNSFDLVVVLLLSNVVQNAIIGDDNSLTGGLLGAVVLVAVNAVVVRIVARSDRLTSVFEGTPTTLVKNGRYIPRALEREGLRAGDVTTALRSQSADEVAEVERAVLEPGGTISFFAKQPDPMTQQFREVNARLEAIVSSLAELRSGLAPQRPA